MNFSLFITAAFLLIAGPAMATTLSNDLVMANQHTASLTEFSLKVSDEAMAESSAGCPAGGLKLVSGATETGSLLGAKGKIARLAPMAVAQARDLSNASQCGVCQQTVTTTPFVITRPAKVAQNALCSERPITTFEADFLNERDAERYTEGILKENNQEGKRLYAACPNPCTFSVYAGKRTLSNGKIRSTMTVSCGHPRSASILTAKYNYSYGTAVQWSCHK